MTDLTQDAIEAVRSIARALGLLAQTIDNVARLSLSSLKGYTVATLPSAADNTRAQIYVSDETGGATLAFSDGTNWRRVQDRVVVS